MKYFALALVILTFAGLLFASLFQFSFIAGEAMSPSLKNHQNILFRKFGLNVTRGDIVLYSVGEEIDYVGRVVGLPTESVRIENVIEEYLPANTITTSSEERKWIKIGEFEYLILTDNRSKPISLQSRLINKNKVKAVLLKAL